MRTLRYVLMTVGMMLSLGGVVAVFNFDRPSDMFSVAWWMIVGGWSLALIGMGMDIIQLFKLVQRKPSYMFESETNRPKGVEGELTRLG